MPKLKVMESDALNAFATGMNQKQYAITVTHGLIGRLDDAEMEAVLGHELTHIRNGDVRMLVIAVIIAGAVSFFAELFFRLWFNVGFGSFGSRAPATTTAGAAATSSRSSSRSALLVARLGAVRSSSGWRCRARANISPMPARWNSPRIPTP